jgi:hypothetical protein
VIARIGAERLGANCADGAARRGQSASTFAPSFPSAVLVRFGKWATVRFRLAAPAAFLMFRRAADRCFDVAISSLFDQRDRTSVRCDKRLISGSPR